MGEEFQESEVIFPENAETNDDDSNFFTSQLNSFQNKKKKKEEVNSIPLKIPQKISGNSWFQCFESDFFEEAKEEELVPPHVIVGRRITGKMAFSVCSGNGRTLKGRDLSQVRNSILRLTGFLET